MAKTILVVDDKKEMVGLIQSYLAQEGYRVVTAGNGREALFVARHEKPDLIVLDLMMPEMGGYEFMQVYRKEADTPIIILTARLDENDRVLGLELGADDYVTKPFSMRELAARVRAVLRRADKEPARKEVLRVADVVLDREYRGVTVAGKAVSLTPSEFDLLAALMKTPGRPFSRLDLLEQLGDAAYEGYERTIDVHIRNLRTKIEPDSKNPRYIQTIYGVGYRFVTDAEG
jgi:DNA-binding response OmpR family regulator